MSHSASNTTLWLSLNSSMAFVSNIFWSHVDFVLASRQGYTPLSHPEPFYLHHWDVSSYLLIEPPGKWNLPVSSYCLSLPDSLWSTLYFEQLQLCYYPYRTWLLSFWSYKCGTWNGLRRHRIIWSCCCTGWTEGIHTISGELGRFIKNVKITVKLNNEKTLDSSYVFRNTYINKLAGLEFG